MLRSRVSPHTVLAVLGVILFILSWVVFWVGFTLVGVLTQVLAWTIVAFLPKKHDKSFPGDQIGVRRD